MFEQTNRRKEWEIAIALEKNADWGLKIKVKQLYDIYDASTHSVCLLNVTFSDDIKPHVI